MILFGETPDDANYVFEAGLRPVVKPVLKSLKGGSGAKKPIPYFGLKSI